MSFTDFFTEQAGNPTGIFGRWIMSAIFNVGNAELNKLVNELMSVNRNDRILEIGFGTGYLIEKMADRLDRGCIEGVDFSDTMLAMAQKRNRKHIASGKVKIAKGDFDEMPFDQATFNKVCSVNTIYFWKNPEHTAAKIAHVLEPGGKFIAAFGDKSQLEKKPLNRDMFRIYSTDDVVDLLMHSGFSNGVRIKTRMAGSTILNCAVAFK